MYIVLVLALTHLIFLTKKYAIIVLIFSNIHSF